MSTAHGIDDYLRESRSWDADRSAILQRSNQTAWRVAAAGWFCALAGSAALFVMMPLKRVDPFVVRVDNSTGIVDVVPVYAGNAALDETVTRYFLSHYVSVCERFDFPTAESDYEECGSFHSAQRNQAWYAAWATRIQPRRSTCTRMGASCASKCSRSAFSHARAALPTLRRSATSKRSRPRPAPGKSTATGSRLSNSRSRNRPGTPGFAAGTRWASRWLTSNRSPK